MRCPQPTGFYAHADLIHDYVAAQLAFAMHDPA